MYSSVDNQESLDVVLEKLTYGGDAMGRLQDGRAIFVPFALPGEQVRVRLRDEKRGFARGELVEILEASPHRTAPRCVHFGLCGGCHYQHLAYEEQLRTKREVLRDQFVRIGRIENPPVDEVVASPSPWNYRNHVQFHLTSAGKLGYMQAHAPVPFAILECHLPEGSLNELWPQLEFEPGTAIERVSLRTGEDSDAMLILESASPDPPQLEIETSISIAHLYAGSAIVLAGSDHVIVPVLGRDFRVSAGSFFQVNTPMAERMVSHLLDSLPVFASNVLLDLYCGAGLFSAFLAPRCGQVIGVESSPSACEDFAFNLDEFDNVELYEGRTENVVPYLETRPDVVLVDPPRAGLERRVLDAILNWNPPIIVYVSCDPSTLARDAARLLRAGYQLQRVTPFDLFPQTYHIESISFFTR